MWNLMKNYRSRAFYVLARCAPASAPAPQPHTCGNRSRLPTPTRSTSWRRRGAAARRVPDAAAPRRAGAPRVRPGVRRRPRAGQRRATVRNATKPRASLFLSASSPLVSGVRASVAISWGLRPRMPTAQRRGPAAVEGQRAQRAIGAGRQAPGFQSARGIADRDSAWTAAVPGGASHRGVRARDHGDRAERERQVAVVVPEGASPGSVFAVAC